MMRIYSPCLLFRFTLSWRNPPRDIASLIAGRGLEQSMHQTEVAWAGLIEITFDWELMMTEPLRESHRPVAMTISSQ